MTLRKGMILITFAWTVEAVGVIAGFVTAVVTTYPDGNLPSSVWPWLIALPMGMIAVAELGRIPLTSVIFRRHTVMQIVALVGIIVLAGLAFENWTFGFERIVQLRLKPVNEAKIALLQVQDRRDNLVQQHKDSAGGNVDKRNELRQGVKDRKDAIEAEEKSHRANLEEQRRQCTISQDPMCMSRSLKAENQRYDEVKQRLIKERDERQNELDEFVKKDRSITEGIEREIKVANADVDKAKATLRNEIHANQIYRLAASYFRVATTDVTDEQFATARWIFATFSALAVSLAGTVAALVYYAAERPRGKYSPIGKMIAGIRAYVARRRRKIYVVKTIYRDGKEIVEKPIPVRQPYLILVPWFIKYPSQISLKDGRVQFKPVDV
jgi:hypothetical protein